MSRSEDDPIAGGVCTVTILVTWPEDVPLASAHVIRHPYVGQ